MLSDIPFAKRQIGFLCDLFVFQPGQVGIAKEQDEDREGFHIW